MPHGPLDENDPGETIAIAQTHSRRRELRLIPDASNSRQRLAGRAVFRLTSYNMRINSLPVSEAARFCVIPLNPRAAKARQTHNNPARFLGRNGFRTSR